MLFKTAHPAAPVAGVRVEAGVASAGAGAGLASSMARPQLLCAVFWGSKGARKGGRSEREGAGNDNLFYGRQTKWPPWTRSSRGMRGWCKARGGSVLAAAPVVAAVTCFPPSHAACSSKQSRVVTRGVSETYACCRVLVTPAKEEKCGSRGHVVA